MILVERQDLWQPRQPSIPTKREWKASAARSRLVVNGPVQGGRA